MVLDTTQYLTAVEQNGQRNNNMFRDGELVSLFAQNKKYVIADLQQM
jgi:hypothetical protein